MDEEIRRVRGLTALQAFAYLLGGCALTGIFLVLVVSFAHLLPLISQVDITLVGAFAWAFAIACIGLSQFRRTAGREASRSRLAFVLVATGGVASLTGIVLFLIAIMPGLLNVKRMLSEPKDYLWLLVVFGLLLMLGSLLVRAILDCLGVGGRRILPLLRVVYLPWLGLVVLYLLAKLLTWLIAVFT